MDLARPEDAQVALRASLARLDSTFVRARAGVLLDLATSLLLQDEVEEACGVVKEALLLARDTQSARYERQVIVFRSQLQPWADSPCVLQLDEELAASA